MGKMLEFLLNRKKNVLGVYKKAAEDFEDAVFILDNNLKIVSASSMAKKLFVGEKGTSNTDLAELFENISEEWSMEWKGRHFRRYASPIRHKDEVYGYFVFFADDTIVHNAINALTREKINFREANTSKTNFLMRLSHEIRNPMNAINGYSELILKEKADDKREKYAESIRDASSNLLTVINAVLDITKVETGEMRRSDTEYELSLLLRRTLENIPSLIKERNITFNCEIEENIPERLFGDCTIIKKIITNVLYDAIKSMETGNIGFSLKGEYEDSGDYIKLVWRITNSGRLAGIKGYENIFNGPALGTTNRKYADGAELGLVAARELIDILDGTVSFVNKAGKGAETTITIRQKVLDRAPMKSTVAELVGTDMKEMEEVEFASARIMIVDDNRINLEVLGQFMQQFGIKPILVGSGEEAVKRAETEDFDIIFMDHLMPEMDGVEAMHRIRALNKKYEDGVIIVLTANVLEGVKEMLIAEGFTEYVSKPISLMKLKELLVKYISNSSTAPVPAAKDDCHIDRAYATENYGYDDDTYNMMLGIIHENFPKDLEKLEEYWKSGDIQNYVITVHALKSNAKSIGALEAADKAYKLEMAGKQGDTNMIQADTAALIETYKRLIEKIGGMMK